MSRNELQARTSRARENVPTDSRGVGERVPKRNGPTPQGPVVSQRAYDISREKDFEYVRDRKSKPEIPISKQPAPTFTNFLHRAAASLPGFGVHSDAASQTSATPWQQYLLDSSPLTHESPPVIDAKQYLEDREGIDIEKGENTPIPEGCVFCVVHKVVCACKDGDGPVIGVLNRYLGGKKSTYSAMQVNGTFYWADMPKLVTAPNGERNTHLAGAYPIKKLEDFLNTLPNTAFVIVQFHECGVEQPHVTELTEADHIPRLRRFEIMVLHKNLKCLFQQDKVSPEQVSEVDRNISEGYVECTISEQDETYADLRQKGSDRSRRRSRSYSRSRNTRSPVPRRRVTDAYPETLVARRLDRSRSRSRSRQREREYRTQYIDRNTGRSRSRTRSRSRRRRPSRSSSRSRKNTRQEKERSISRTRRTPTPSSVREGMRYSSHREQGEDLAGYNYRSTSGLSEAYVISYIRLYRQRKVLAARAEMNKGLLEGDLLRALLHYVDDLQGHLYTFYDLNLEKGLIHPNHLELLYQRNTLIITRAKDRTYRARMIYKVDRRSPFEIRLGCWHWGFDGFDFTEEAEWRTAWEPSMLDAKLMRIEDLDNFPLKYASPMLQEQLLARGHKFWKLRRRGYVLYSGWTSDHRSLFKDTRFIIDPSFSEQLTRKRVASEGNDDPHQNCIRRPMVNGKNKYGKAFEVITTLLDLASAFEENGSGDDSEGSKGRRGRRNPKRQQGRSYRPIDHEELSIDLREPAQDNLLLLPTHIQGFDLLNRTNDNFSVSLWIDNISEIPWDESALDRLVIPDNTLALVQALVSRRAQIVQSALSYDKNEIGPRSDFVSGKGEGLIILLHGGPGTGKTLTAECLAEHVKLPLYSVTARDLGTTAAAVDRALKEIFEITRRWSCVLLLDEADIFLQERQLTDLDRNTLVSVFLQALEYFDGILFLTSNRVGTIDEAFQSRIQLALHYRDLDEISRRKIWENFINMMQEDGEKANFTQLKAGVQDLAKHKINGRQIRNATATARELALYKEEELGIEHIKQAIGPVEDFEKYLRKLHGHSNEDWAQQEGLRYHGL